MTPPGNPAPARPAAAGTASLPPAAAGTASPPPAAAARTASPLAAAAAGTASSPPAAAAGKVSPPAAAACRVLVAAVVALLIASPPAAAAWRRPVPGAVARPFAYSPAEPFVAGRHRGVDLAARPGAGVRAACSGRVAFAGREVVTLHCGPWRVTHLPLAAIVVRAGERVREGARIGTLAASRAHAGLHLGVRRAGDRFAYVDPLPFLGGARPPVTIPAPPTGLETRPRSPAGVPRNGPGAARAPARVPRASPVRVPRASPVRVPRASPVGVPRASPVGVPRASPVGVPRASPVRAPVAPPGRVRVSPDRRIAPWPVWVGLALALSGAIGGGIRVRGRNRRPVAESVAS